jgi:hypothetical protein
MDAIDIEADRLSRTAIRARLRALSDLRRHQLRAGRAASINH